MIVPFLKMKEMILEDKLRIEKEAEGISRLRIWPEHVRVTFKTGYINGATAEHERDWITSDPKTNGMYLVKVMMCDMPYEEAERIDEFKNGYWINYAQFVLSWKPIPGCILSLLKEERNKAIDECIEALSKHHDSIEKGDDYSVGVGNCINLLCSKLEKAKGKSQ